MAIPCKGAENDNKGDQKQGQDCGGCGAARIASAMPTWWVSQPKINLRLDDTPLGYRPSRGLPVSFGVAYRQRTDLPQDLAVFGLGTNWTTSFRAYLLDASGGLFRLQRGGPDGIDDYYDYSIGTPQFFDGSYLTTPDGGLSYRIEYSDGAVDVFGKSFVNGQGQTLYFLTARSDPTGNTLTFNYDGNPNIVRLNGVTDPDNRSTQLFYEHATFTNLITRVVDPFSRTNLLQYDASGFLTNIVDVAGLASSFKYDAGSRRAWITNLTTPYGTTAFRFGGVNAETSGFFDGSNQVNRFVEVTQPNSGRHLYLYRQDCGGILAATNSAVPVTSPFANTLDNVDHDQRNSFHWEPLQYAGLSSNYVQSGNVANLTSTDYVLGSLRHWLVDPATAQASRVVSLARAPSPDGVTLGQLTWYDYEGKTANNSNGVTALAKLEARVLPDGSTWFERVARNSRGAITNFVSTYTALAGTGALRTNVYVYATNEVDLVQEIGPQGEQVVSNHFNAYHQPVVSHDALNETTACTYNTNQQVTSIASPAGLTTLNVYYTSGADANRLQQTMELEIGRTNSYTYYASGLVYSHTDPRGLTTTYFYDELERLTGVAYPDGTTLSNRFTTLDITARKDRLGWWTYTAYNSMRQKVAETNASGGVSRFGYCDCGALLYVTNAWNTPAAMVTSYGYDYQGHRIYEIQPDVTITNWFDALGQLITTCDPWGCRWYSYNNQGRLTSVTNSLGAAEQTTVYDIEDRPLWVTDANGVTITNAYDELGRLRTRTHPDGGVESFGYSARGLIAYTNQLGFTNFYAYDEAGRKTFETNANWELIRYTNNASGDLLALVDGKGQVTKWNYDEYGRVTNKLDQAGTVVLKYTYNANGRLVSRWSVAKGTTFYTNDAVGNLTYVNYPASPDVTFAYDALNRVTNMVDAVGTTAYGYAIGGQLWTEDGPWSNDTVTNTYANRLRTGLNLAQPTGQWTNLFAYDAAKRLTNVTSPAGAFGYTFVGQASRLTQKLSLPNSSYITNAYDNVARLRFTRLNNSSHTTLDSADYSYNASNQRTGFTNAAGTAVSYTYDRVGQLKIADSSVGSEDRGYVYDAAWNMTKRTNYVGATPVITSYPYNNLNELNAGSHRYTYDGNGNRTSWHDDLPLYEYDDENRLTTIEHADGWRTEFAYDGLGRLRERLEYTGAPENWTLASTTRYIYDGWRVIQERDGSNVPTASYTRGPDLSGSLEGAGGIGGLLARSYGYSAGNWSTHTYYHADGNGNVTYLVNSSQTQAASYRYDPFGNLIDSSDNLASPNPYRFSSKELHANSGLYYYGYRFYDPSVQRWLNRDPIEEDGGVNLYVLAGNNPLTHFDPNGHLDCSDPCGAAKLKHLDEGNPAGTVCCNGKKYPCVWDPKGNGNPWDPKAKRIIKDCLEAHEKSHVNDPTTTCNPGCLEIATSADPKAECRALDAGLQCLRKGLVECDGNPYCIRDVLEETRAIKGLKREKECPK